MRNQELIEFKQKLESKREIFDVNVLPEYEWSVMLEKAKRDTVDLHLSSRNSRLGVYTQNFYSVFSSLKLSATISIMLFIALVIGYTIFMGDNYRTIKKTNNSAINRSRMDIKPPVINVSAKGFI